VGRPSPSKGFLSRMPILTNPQNLMYNALAEFNLTTKKGIHASNY